jgi:hypothetical protein
MDIVHEPGRRIEFRSRFAPAARLLILIGGLLPLLAPYQLLVRSSWRGQITPVWLFLLLVSAGAVAVSAVVVSAALFSPSQRVRFDASRQVITHAFWAPALRHRVERFPFSALRGLRVDSHAWTDGPDTYTLVATVGGHRDIAFGSFTARPEADRYLLAVQGIVRGGGPG